MPAGRPYLVHCDGLPDFIQHHYEIYELRYACTILQNDFPDQGNDVIDALTRFRLLKSPVTVGGGGAARTVGAIGVGKDYS